MKPFLLAFTVCLVPFLHAENKHSPAPPFDSTLPWLTDLDEALAASKKTGKPILAEFR